MKKRPLYSVDVYIEAVRIAEQLGHNYIGTAHFVYAFLRLTDQKSFANFAYKYLTEQIGVYKPRRLQGLYYTKVLMEHYEKSVNSEYVIMSIYRDKECEGGKILDAIARGA